MYEFGGGLKLFLLLFEENFVSLQLRFFFIFKEFFFVDLVFQFDILEFYIFFYIVIDFLIDVIK